MVATVVAEGVFTVAAAGVAESVTARATVAAVMSDISTSADDFTSNDGTESGGFGPAGAWPAWEITGAENFVCCTVLNRLGPFVFRFLSLFL